MFQEVLNRIQNTSSKNPSLQVKSHLQKIKLIWKDQSRLIAWYWVQLGFEGHGWILFAYFTKTFIRWARVVTLLQICRHSFSLLFLSPLSLHTVCPHVLLQFTYLTSQPISSWAIAILHLFQFLLPMFCIVLQQTDESAKDIIPSQVRTDRQGGIPFQVAV